MADDREKPLDEKTRKQLEHYRERMRKRAGGESSKGNAINAATERTAEATAAPEQREGVGPSDSEDSADDVEISGPKKSLLEELLAYQDASGLSEEELIARLIGPVDLTDDRHDEILPGSFPGTGEVQATPSVRPASS